MLKGIRSVIDWIGRYQVVQSIIYAEFFRTLLLPTIWTGLVTGFGIVEHLSAMWIAMAGALTFMGVTQALLRADELKERKNPEHKLAFIVVFQVDLNEAPMPVIGNRQQRRIHARKEPRQMLSSTQLLVHVNRTIQKGQLGIEITNTASFPISMFLSSADTEIGDFSPPRSDFPKPKVLIGAKDKIRIMDDAIEMDNFPCQKLNGVIDLLVKYGLPGKEKYDLHVKGPVEIPMEHYGFVSTIFLDRTGG